MISGLVLHYLQQGEFTIESSCYFSKQKKKISCHISLSYDILSTCSLVMTEATLLFRWHLAWKLRLWISSLFHAHLLKLHGVISKQSVKNKKIPAG